MRWRGTIVAVMALAAGALALGACSDDEGSGGETTVISTVTASTDASTETGTTATETTGETTTAPDPATEASPREAARTVVEEFFGSLLAKDAKGFCETLGPRPLAVAATGAGGTPVDRCISRFRAFSREGTAKDVAEADPIVEGVTVKGDKATVIVSVVDGAEREQRPLEVVEVDGEWKVNDLDAFDD